jgi:hypothetical protein
MRDAGFTLTERLIFDAYALTRAASGRVGEGAPTTFDEIRREYEARLRWYKEGA